MLLNERYYHSEDLINAINEAGLEVEEIHDQLGQGHSIIICKINNN